MTLADDDRQLLRDLCDQYRVSLNKAREILRSRQHFIQNAEEWRRFADTLENPPEPNDTLQAAWRDYRDAEPE